MISITIEGPGIDPREMQLKPGKTYLLGRDPENDIVLSDDTVSREHAKIEIPIDANMVIEDLSSTAGIYVNKEKISGKTGVNHGDTLLIGQTFIKIDAINHVGNMTRAIDNEELQKILCHEKEHVSVDNKTDMKKDDVANGYNQTFCMNEKDATDYGRSKGFYKLIVKTGNRFSGKEYVLDESEISIGRSKDCYIRVKDKMVSSHHLLLRIEDDTYFLRDLGSSNGTRINSVSIMDSQTLQDGDEIEIGDTTLRFVYQDSVNLKNDELVKSRKLTFLTGVTTFYETIKNDIPVLFSKLATGKYNKELAFSFITVFALIFLALGVSKLTKRDGEKSAVLDSDHQMLLVESIDSYVQGNVQMALKRLNDVLELNLKPDHQLKSRAASLIEKITKIQSLFTQGYDQYRKRRFLQSIDTFRYVLELDSEVVKNKKSYYSEEIFIYVVNSYYNMAKEAYDKNNYVKSKEYCEKAFRLNPEHEGAVKIKTLLADKTNTNQ